MTSVLAACDPAASLYRSNERPRYTYNGRDYYTLDEATRAVRALVNEEVAAVKPLKNRVGGRALVVLPDSAQLRPFLVAEHGRGSERDEKDHPERAISYRLSLMAISLNGQVAALQQSKLFDAVDVVERKDPGDPDFDGHDYLVWFKVATSEGGRWYQLWQVRHAPEQAAERAGIDSGASQRDRMISWVESVQRAAFSLGGGAPSRGGGSIETGIVISAAGHIVTNNHGVKACHEVRVLLAGEPFPATLLAHDAENDLALLKADHVFPISAKFRANPIRQGESVVAVGFPFNGLIGSGSDVIVTTGIVNALTGIQNDTRFLQISAPIQPGNSGGPLLDASGLVTGIVTKTLSTVVLAERTGVLPQNLNFAIKPAVVRNFLDANAASYATAPPGKELSTADIAAAAKAFTVKVECLAAPS